MVLRTLLNVESHFEVVEIVGNKKIGSYEKNSTKNEGHTIKKSLYEPKIFDNTV